MIYTRDLHECLGHGSGRLLPGTDPDALKNYGNTIEEARADLFGLYYIADEKLLDLGLLDSSEAYKSTVLWLYDERFVDATGAHQARKEHRRGSHAEPCAHRMVGYGPWK